MTEEELKEYGLELVKYYVEADTEFDKVFITYKEEVYGLKTAAWTKDKKHMTLFNSEKEANAWNVLLSGKFKGTVMEYDGGNQ